MHMYNLIKALWRFVLIEFSQLSNNLTRQKLLKNSTVICENPEEPEEEDHIEHPKEFPNRVGAV